MASEQEKLANVVKSLHQKLRNDLKTANGDFEKVWKDHCSDQDSLQKYAVAMHSLATKQWTKNSPGGRADWCFKTCLEYFKYGLNTAIEKQRRRINHEMATHCCCCLDTTLTALDFTRDKKLNLLDVGSCYNPFSTYEELSSVGIDLQPATESVYKCDFLSVEVVDKDKLKMESYHGKSSHKCKPTNTEKDCDVTGVKAENLKFSQDKIDIKKFLQDPVVQLLGEYFHIVVFSLLLSYFPSPVQRWTCCIKAHQLLTINGILIIITPDSSHQNRNVAMMKSWKSAIESMGFVRWRYLKDTHVHCMVFRKVAPCHHSCSQTCTCNTSVDITPEMLYTRQDFCDDDGNDDDDDNSAKNSIDGENSEQKAKKRKIDI